MASTSPSSAANIPKEQTAPLLLRCDKCGFPYTGTAVHVGTPCPACADGRLLPAPPAEP